MSELTFKADARDVAADTSAEGFELGTLTMYDVPSLASLYMSAYGEPYTQDSFWEATDEIRLYFDGAFGDVRDDGFIGVWEGGSLVGAIFSVIDSPFEQVPDGPFVLDLIVDPEYRRRGIATALVGELGNRIKDWGYDSVTLRLDEGRMPEAFNLYRRMGFAPMSEAVPDEA